ncbi:LisH domain-containing protein [Aphelenchoides fujianensis]|nr:LisH domain-containing protein [Aphelenchoides fujianensis]
MRTFRLLQTVNALENSQYEFSNSGDILFAVKDSDEPGERYYVRYDSSFRVLDAKDYHVITTVDTKRDLIAFGIDHNDRHICTVEESRNREDEQTLCRVYEIGRMRGDGEIEEEEDDGTNDEYDPADYDEDLGSESLGSQETVDMIDYLMNGDDDDEDPDYQNGEVDSTTTPEMDDSADDDYDEDADDEEAEEDADADADYI